MQMHGSRWIQLREIVMYPTCLREARGSILLRPLKLLVFDSMIHPPSAVKTLLPCALRRTAIRTAITHSIPERLRWIIFGLRGTTVTVKSTLQTRSHVLLKILRNTRITLLISTTRLDPCIPSRVQILHNRHSTSLRRTAVRSIPVRPMLTIPIAIRRIIRSW